MLHHMKLKLGMVIFVASASSLSYAISHHDWKQFVHITSEFETWTDTLVNTRDRQPYSVFIHNLKHILTELDALAKSSCLTQEPFDTAFKIMLKELHTELQKVYNVLANPAGQNGLTLARDLQQKCVTVETMTQKIDAHLGKMVKLAKEHELSFASEVAKFKKKNIATLTKKKASHTPVACITGLCHRLNCKK
jgi:hypothetical protein